MSSVNRPQTRGFVRMKNDVTSVITPLRFSEIGTCSASTAQDEIKKLADKTLGATQEELVFCIVDNVMPSRPLPSYSSTSAATRFTRNADDVSQRKVFLYWRETETVPCLSLCPPSNSNTADSRPIRASTPINVSGSQQFFAPLQMDSRPIRASTPINVSGSQQFFAPLQMDESESQAAGDMTATPIMPNHAMKPRRSKFASVAPKGHDATIRKRASDSIQVSAVNENYAERAVNMNVVKLPVEEKRMRTEAQNEKMNSKGAATEAYEAQKEDIRRRRMHLKTELKMLEAEETRIDEEMRNQEKKRKFAMSGNVRSDEDCAKMSRTLGGNVITEECKQAPINFLRGSCKPEEAAKKVCEVTSTPGTMAHYLQVQEFTREHMWAEDDDGDDYFASRPDELTESAHFPFLANLDVLDPNDSLVKAMGTPVSSPVLLKKDNAKGRHFFDPDDSPVGPKHNKWVESDEEEIEEVEKTPAQRTQTDRYVSHLLRNKPHLFTTSLTPNFPSDEAACSSRAVSNVGRQVDAIRENIRKPRRRNDSDVSSLQDE